MVRRLIDWLAGKLGYVRRLPPLPFDPAEYTEKCADRFWAETTIGRNAMEDYKQQWNIR